MLAEDRTTEADRVLIMEGEEDDILIINGRNMRNFFANISLASSNLNLWRDEDEYFCTLYGRNN